MCGGETLDFGLKEGEGRLIDDRTWESNAMEEAWLPYGPRQILRLSIPYFSDRIPLEVKVYISGYQAPNQATPDPNQPIPDNFALASGNLAETFIPGPGQVVVHNNTCAHFYARVVIHFPPRVPFIPPPSP
ncbi:hypothetical protein BCY86_01680 [Pajaroellobacter abortibovis]|uniref:Uncharacterized protein n=2 Tax=Pajaroellobacter abortibovis TaxID=1882918 RepID=A0A1L6MVH5_9BACT|nr:hypothetical protein BCY86_01680 [Pajaroellobacter abortibovis]